ncbi:ABC transporter substrate-binding protein [Mitsuokella sp. UBA4253]|uniref:ABC transporter substrate-binding protein n=1 Tax=Mitsuokella sp. UBA4253 TaxID=1946959 RepID=UPI0025811945|nr:ABC transporter substrate-binding protein [Mitsuokella sp. UBA4253]
MKKLKKLQKIISLALGICLSASLMAGCGQEQATSPGGQKTLVIGDTTFNSSNEESDVNPHNAYSGWACIRYGIGETLVKYSDDMAVEPWLAVKWENIDELTWKFTLRDDVTFSSGRRMDAAAVKECVEHLIANNKRAEQDLKIASIEAEGQELTIKTKEPNPALLNYLGDPYGCIVDVQAGFDGGMASGTGPYIAEDVKTDDHLILKKNEHYWGGSPKLDKITIRTITDGNTLSSALQAGEVQAAYGLAYESYPLFRNDKYVISQIPTSRCFFGKMNFDPDSVCADPAVRKAISMGIDKENFVTKLLDGNGSPASGVFPAGPAYGGDKVKSEAYDPEGAKKVLEEAGWLDTDGDGIREKAGRKLVVKWLTYPSRQELPLLAESAQASLKEIGMDVDINCTADNNQAVKDVKGWDVYAMANVQAPTGDPEYWFTVFATSDATKNQGKYRSEKLDALEAQLSREFDPAKRAQLAIDMQQVILDDHAFVFCSFLKMSMIAKANVKNYTSHPCDYYQVTADLDVE